MKNQRGLQGARRLFVVQLSLIVWLSCLFWLLFDARAAGSIALGGLVWVLPQACFALIVFSEQRARYSKAIVSRIYRGEAFKLVFSAVLFAGVFYLGHVLPLMFFVGYMLAQGVSWFAPLFFRNAVTKVSVNAV
jgi:ATP synthase protein I